MPRKSLFGTTTTPSPLLKDEPVTVIKKEINNSFQNGNIGNSDFIKKTDNTNNINNKKEIKEEIIEDDGDDWSAVPAFLRRNKK